MPKSSFLTGFESGSAIVDQAMARRLQQRQLAEFERHNVELEALSKRGQDIGEQIDLERIESREKIEQDRREQAERFHRDRFELEANRFLLQEEIQSNVMLARDLAYKEELDAFDDYTQAKAKIMDLKSQNLDPDLLDQKTAEVMTAHARMWISPKTKPLAELLVDTSKDFSEAKRNSAAYAVIKKAEQSGFPPTPEGAQQANRDELQAYAASKGVPAQEAEQLMETFAPLGTGQFKPSDVASFRRQIDERASGIGQISEKASLTIRTGSTFEGGAEIRIPLKEAMGLRDDPILGPSIRSALAGTGVKDGFGKLGGDREQLPEGSLDARIEKINQLIEAVSMGLTEGKIVLDEQQLKKRGTLDWNPWWGDMPAEQALFNLQRQKQHLAVIKNIRAGFYERQVDMAASQTLQVIPKGQAMQDRPIYFPKTEDEFEFVPYGAAYWNPEKQRIYVK